MDFTTMDISTITRSVTGDGVRYLELFLREYSSVFNTKVNPGCPLCLTRYLQRYKNHFKAMENTSGYRLHAKYENIPLEFGSPVLVNNINLTDEYALKLLQHKNGERYFAQIPLDASLTAAKTEEPSGVRKKRKKQRPQLPTPVSANKTTE